MSAEQLAQLIAAAEIQSRTFKIMGSDGGTVDVYTSLLAPGVQLFELYGGKDSPKQMRGQLIRLTKDRVEPLSAAH